VKLKKKQEKWHHFVDGERPTETQVPFFAFVALDKNTHFYNVVSKRIIKEEKHPTPKTWKEWKPMICRDGIIAAREAGKSH
jgi:hypothetical protein